MVATSQMQTRPEAARFPVVGGRWEENKQWEKKKAEDRITARNACNRKKQSHNCGGALVLESIKGKIKGGGGGGGKPSFNLRPSGAVGYRQVLALAHDGHKEGHFIPVTISEKLTL